MPTLYLVGTPIGNLEDMTFRAVRILQEVGLVAAEDTRRAKVLFARYGIKTALTSYHEQGNRSKAPAILKRLQQTDVALITEAGMPTISDPGYRLVRDAIEAGIPIDVVPGASAITTAVAVSGLPPDQFVFVGFLPRKAGERRKLLTSLAGEPRTLVVLEAPHRVRASLKEIGTCLGERPIAVCREMTKLHQEVFRGTPKTALEHFQTPRGEFTLVISGGHQRKEQPSNEAVRSRLAELRDESLSAKEAIALVVGETGMPRRQVYQHWLDIQNKE
ncbi:MAG: 16S rRNA (cytidine(1402)-2'-O)-methyltransferase [Chloroflexi bacterium]|nr:16S rRNA (cytidine(1402)-2'-O)-methyltransferase [Chloroflexota bacterium]